MALKKSFRRFNAITQDIMNDFLELYQKFNTADVQERSVHRDRLRAHFDVRADQRLPTILHSKPQTWSHTPKPLTLVIPPEPKPRPFIPRP